MYESTDEAPMVPTTNDPTIYTACTDGGGQRSDTDTGPRFDRPPETAGSEADRHHEEIEPGAADLR